jgi:hypothetical protein
MATRDLPNVVHVESVEQLRAKLLELGDAPAFVVFPAATAILDKYYQDIPAQLSDLIPTYLWRPGPLDQHQIPTVWYAFVRGP